MWPASPWGTDSSKAMWTDGLCANILYFIQVLGAKFPGSKNKISRNKKYLLFPCFWNKLSRNSVLALSRCFQLIPPTVPSYLRGQPSLHSSPHPQEKKKRKVFLLLVACGLSSPHPPASRSKFSGNVNKISMNMNKTFQGI
jgi:hypothetical protein